eukprot:5484556-Pyramimonas_sp.AAC.1
MFTGLSPSGAIPSVEMAPCTGPIQRNLGGRVHLNTIDDTWDYTGPPPHPAPAPSPNPVTSIIISSSKIV